MKSPSPGRARGNRTQRICIAILLSALGGSACSAKRRAPARAAVDVDAGGFEVQSAGGEEDPSRPEGLELDRCSGPVLQGTGRSDLRHASPALVGAVLRSRQSDAPASFLLRRANEGRLRLDAAGQSLTGTITPEGRLVLTSRRREGQTELETAGLFGHKSGIRAAEWVGTSTSPAISDNTARFAHAGFEESFVYGPLGVDHGFRISAPETSIDELRIELELPGAAPPGDGGVHVHPTGGVALRSDGPFSSDARGQPLESRFEATASGLAVVVQTDQARWPIRIHSLWRLEASEAAAGAWDRLLDRPVLVQGEVAVLHAGDAVAIYRKQGAGWRLEHRAPTEPRRLGRRGAIDGDRILLTREAPFDVALFERRGEGWEERTAFSVSSCPIDVELDGDVLAVLQAHRVSTWRRRGEDWQPAAKLAFLNQSASFPKNFEDASSLSLAGGWMALSIRNFRTWQESRRACDFAGCTNHVAYPSQHNYFIRILSVGDDGELGAPFEKLIGTFARYYRWDGVRFATEEVREGRSRPEAVRGGEGTVSFTAEESANEGGGPTEYVLRRSGGGWLEVASPREDQQVELAAGE